MPYKEVIATVSAFIAIIGAIVSARNLRISAKKFEMDSFKWQREYFSDLSKWADACLDALSEAVHLCDVDPARSHSFFDARIASMSKLSAMIDRGRFFFPNYESHHGKQKPRAYQGYRHEVLDTLVEAYRLVDQLSYSQHALNRPAREPLVNLKRQFTSFIQSILDPKSRQAEYEKIIASVNRAA